MKQVTVVIPNWDGKDLLGPCLKSLYRQEFRDFDTIVVDNGSTDGSVSFLDENFPQVRIIRFEENRGFSAAVNAGILASNASYIALLNNDTEVHPLWLKELVAGLDAHPEAGSAASKILFSDNPNIINSAGDEFSWFGVAYQRGKGCIDDSKYNTPCFVFSACAGAALYRREVFDRIGLFDESFFAYLEDVDFGFRAQLAGYPCIFVPTAVIYHKYQITSSRVSGLAFYLSQRNKYFVVAKNIPNAILLLCLPLFALHEGLCLAKAVRRGHLRAYFKALKDAWVDLPRLLGMRQEIQGQGVLTSTEVGRSMRFIDPLWSFFLRSSSSALCFGKTPLASKKVGPISDPDSVDASTQDPPA